MKVCFVSNGEINKFWESAENNRAQVIFFGFNGIGEVSYEEELAGKSYKLEDIAIMSKELKCVIISGCYTDSYTLRRKSAVIADCGKILGVSDSVTVIDDAKFGCGASIRAYDTSAGRIGLVISDDICFPEVVKTLSLADAEIIMCPYEQLCSNIPIMMSRSNAYAYGITICFCAQNYHFIALPSGEISVAGQSDISVCDASTERQYHIIARRARGFFSQNKDNF
jgi:hypothetical protein